MITESRHPETGIIRFDISTTRCDLCRRCIEKSRYIKTGKNIEGDMYYEAEYKGSLLHITSTETRTIIYGENRRAMLEFFEAIKGDERTGTAWAYDDSKRSDYQNAK